LELPARVGSEFGFGWIDLAWFLPAGKGRGNGPGSKTLLYYNRITANRQE